MSKRTDSFPETLESSIHFSCSVCLTLCDLWTAAHQASLAITNSQSLLKLMAIELVMPSSHLILYYPLFSCLQPLPVFGSFLISQLFALGDQSIGASASASVLQDWFPLGLTGLISLQSKGLSTVFSNTTVQKQEHWFSHVLSCPSACGIFLDQKSNPCPLH